jgi:hypothetical protein
MSLPIAASFTSGLDLQKFTVVLSRHDRLIDGARLRGASTSAIGRRRRFMVAYSERSGGEQARPLRRRT